MGYRFGQFFVPLESPDADPRFAMLFGVVIPWLVFLGSFLIGLLLMRFYRRSLHNYHDLLVNRLIQAKGERQALSFLQQLKIDWPLWALGVIVVGVTFSGESAQRAAWSMSCLGGLFASVMTTYVERKQIYDDAINALGEAGVTSDSPSSISNLPVRMRALLAFSSLLLCIAFSIAIWFTVRIVVSIEELLDLTQPM